jgi:hypothetical protein
LYTQNGSKNKFLYKKTTGNFGRTF